jgi:hyperosmotically inducible protein
LAGIISFDSINRIPRKGAAMNRYMRVAAVLLLVLASTSFAIGQVEPTNPAQMRIQKEVRHELLMLPYFTVFDNIAFQVNSGTVTLLGQVTRPSLKSDAEGAIKHIEGVDHVVNNIEVLPLSPMDNQSRIALYRAIYGFPSMEKYAMGVQKPIRIIVSNGHVTLEGVVDNQSDKDTAGIRANGVSGVFSVTNNLQVVPN